ncbi:DoxX family protein [Brevibacillus sp. SYSU BS000544]|uniref:DoxX family protein n=1 Tax=Brevibacillus sp. SYSU BS000544 TaxID=3416443 RepID=UPI003CE509F3
MMKWNNDTANLLLRVVLGITFLVHGLDKFGNGIENVVGFFGKIGLPGFMAYFVAGVEVVGGIALILGLGTRIFSALFAIIMLVAIGTVKIGKGFSGGYEFELALMAMSLSLVVSGARFMALDSLFTKKSSVSNS